MSKYVLTDDDVTWFNDAGFDREFKWHIEPDDEDEPLIEPLLQTHVEPLHRIRAKDTQPRWIVRGVIPSGISLLFGDKGSFKTSVALSIALSIASGRPWLGRYQVRKGRVLYLAAEGAPDKRIAAYKESYMLSDDDLRNIWRLPAVPGVLRRLPKEISARQARAKKAEEMALRHVGYFTDEERLQLYKEDAAAEADPRHSAEAYEAKRAHYQQLAEVFEREQAFRPDFIVMDTFSNYFDAKDGKENDNDDVRTYLRKLTTLAKSYGASVLIVHHTGNDKTKPRGATALEAWVDSSFRLRSQGDGLLLEPQKHPREEEAPPALYLTKAKVEIPLTDEGREALIAIGEEPIPDSAIVVVSGEPHERSGRRVTDTTKAPDENRIVTFLKSNNSTEGQRSSAIESATGLKGGTFQRQMKKATESGQVEKVGKGRYRLVQLPAAA
jgi:hypothetical protein